MFKDVVEWVQHPNRTGVFFHEENICEYESSGVNIFHQNIISAKEVITEVLNFSKKLEN